jgi:hypothetical protein
MTNLVTVSLTCAPLFAVSESADEAFQCGRSCGFLTLLFYKGGVGFFRQTGQRVFVNGDTISELGVPDTLTLMPVTATIGYRFRGRSVAAFVGGGTGQYLYSEQTSVDQSAEYGWHHANSFHGLGGVEFRAVHGMAIAVQGRYTRVPGALAGGNGINVQGVCFRRHSVWSEGAPRVPQHQRDPMTNR